MHVLTLFMLAAKQALIQGPRVPDPEGKNVVEKRVDQMHVS